LTFKITKAGSQPDQQLARPVKGRLGNTAYKGGMKRAQMGPEKE
jgi:hypothetical protein